MKIGIILLLSLMIFGTLICSGCTSNSQGYKSDYDTHVATEIQGVDTDIPSEESPVMSTNKTGEDIITDEPVSKAYVPLWPAGTLLSDKEKKGWGLITKVKKETSEYYLRNVLYPEEGEPYIIKDSTFEEMGITYPAKGIDKKYVNFEGKVIKIPIVSSTGSSILGYLKYDDNKTMKHTIGE